MAPIYLLHGALSTSHSMQRLAASFSGFDMVMPDLLAHDTTPYNGTLSIEAFARQITDLAAKNGHQHIHIIGHSLGGYIGLYLASRQPELIASVFTFGTKLAWNSVFALQETATLVPSTIREKQPKWAAAMETQHENWETLVERVAAFMNDLGSNPRVSREMLAAIACPVRFGIGDRDHMVTIDETLDAYHSMTVSQLQVFPQTGHPVERIAPVHFPVISDFFTSQLAS